jgi:hypothetical protein
MSEVAATAPVAAPSAPAAPAAPAEIVTDDQKPAAEAPAPKGDETKPDTPDPAESKRGQSRYDRKIGRLHKEAAEQKARAEFFEKQYNEARAQKPAADTPAEGAPTLAQFDYDPEKYAKALANYEIERKTKETTEKQRTESARQEHQRLVNGWAEKVDKGDAKYEDFDEKVGDLTKHINIPAVAAIMEAENAEDLAYYFGSNPKEFERIVQLHPRAQVREIGKLEAKLQAEPPKPKTPSSAPAPIKPVGGASAASTKRLSELSQDEFEKRRKAQIAQRR